MIRKYFHWIVLGILVVAGIYIQSHSIKTLVYPFTDEGVYLYASKLVAQGYIIYQDFFLIHLPLWIYINAAVLSILHWNIDLYHFIYVGYVVAGVIPLYLLIYRRTKITAPALVASLIYLTYPEMAQWDMHMFAMRQASLPLLGWGLYHLIATKKLRSSAVFLAFFSMSLVTNFLITILIVGGWIIWRVSAGGYTKSKKIKLKEIIPLVAPFLILSSIYYVMILLIPNAYRDVFGYQLENRVISLVERIVYLRGMVKLNWVIFATGLAGWIVIPQKLRWLSISFVLASILILLGTRSFYPHYLVILAIPLSIGSGFLCDYLINLGVTKWGLVGIVAIGLYISTGKHLANHLWSTRNDNFFQVVSILKQRLEPVFSFEPIYAVHAGKLLTFHEHVADARSFRVLGQYYTPQQYIELIDRSQTVLLDPYTKSVLPQLAYQFVRENFKLISNTGGIEIWSK